MRAELRADRGDGSPILYIPGIDGTGELLLGTAARLELGWRLVRFCYRAEPVHQEEAGVADTYPALADSIAAGCDQLELSRVLVVAESFGGAVAMQLALDHPELVAGLLIVNSFARYPSRTRLAWALRSAPYVPRFAFDLGRRWFAPSSLFGGLRERQATADFRALPGAFFDHSYCRRLRMIAGLDLMPRLGELSQPTALVASDADRIVPSLSCMGEIAGRLPDATLERVAGGGHLILPLAAQPWEERIRALEERVARSRA